MPIASVDSNDSTAGNFSPMATLTIRNLDDAVRDRLRQRAAEHGHSMEEEVRQILRQVVKPADTAAASEGWAPAFTTTSPGSGAPNWSCHHGATRLQRLIS